MVAVGLVSSGILDRSRGKDSFTYAREISYAGVS